MFKLSVSLHVISVASSCLNLNEGSPVQSHSRQGCTIPKLCFPFLYDSPNVHVDPSILEVHSIYRISCNGSDEYVFASSFYLLELR
jgi:hypothetical protein